MKAHCLCGAVTFDAEIPKRAVMLCHCAQCRRWTGGGPLSVVRANGIEITGAEHIETYHASEHGERAFCRTCGTTLYWTMQGKPPAFLPVGLFDDQSGFEVTDEIFADRRPDWLPCHAGANQSTEAEQLEQLRAYQEQQP